jgi:hypothetical protein
MSDESSEKQRCVGVRNVLSREGHIGEEVPRVVEGHDHHDQAAQNVYRDDALKLCVELGDPCRRGREG